MCEISTRAGLSFSEESDTNNSVSEPILSKKLLYNSYSFV